MSNATESILQQVERALARLESGDVEGARTGLRVLLAGERPASGFASPPPPAPATPLHFEPGFGDEEIDTAFDRAETQADEMRDATDVAHEAMQEAIGETALEPGPDIFTPGEDSAYATATMAAVLERQGDRDGAEAIRARLDEAESAPRPLPEVEAMDAAEAPAPAPVAGPVVPLEEPGPGSGPGTRERQIATLERWLGNLRRHTR